MTTSIRSGTSNDGYWQVNATDVVKITTSLIETLTSLRVNSTTNSTGISINANATPANAALVYTRSASPRWSINMDNQTETGSNVGSDFGLYAYSDTGSTLSIPMQISRATGKTSFNQSVTVSSNVSNGAVVNVNTTGANGAAFAWQKSGVSRWSMNIGNVETGSNVGSDFVMYRFDDAGNIVGNPITINRTTSATSIGGSLAVLNNSLVVSSQVAGDAAVGSFQVPSPGPADGQVGQINFCDMSNIGGAGVEKRLAGVVAFRDVVADATAGGRLEFWTRANNAANWTSRMQINNAGTVTIPGQLQSKYIRESMMSAASVTGAYTLDIPANGSIQNLLMTGNTSLTFPGGAGWSGVSFTLVVKQGASPFTLTWPASVRWSGGGANSAFIVLPTTANLSHIYTFLYDGVVWLGSVGGQNYTR